MRKYNLNTSVIFSVDIKIMSTARDVHQTMSTTLPIQKHGVIQC
jgi:hypothetical protein